MTSNLAVAKSVSTLGSDPNYWTTAANVILRVKAEMLQERWRPRLKSAQINSLTQRAAGFPALSSERSRYSAFASHLLAEDAVRCEPFSPHNRC